MSVTHLVIHMLSALIGSLVGLALMMFMYEKGFDWCYDHWLDFRAWTKKKFSR
jgi:hypothetical protein